MTLLKKYYNKARTLLDPDELLTAVDSGRIAYATPEDTLSVYASGVYKQIADTALEERLIKLFSDSSNGLAKKYDVTVVKDLKNVLKSGEEKKFRRIGAAGETGGRTTKKVSYEKLEDTGEVKRLPIQLPLLNDSGCSIAYFLQTILLLLSSRKTSMYFSRLNEAFSVL